MLHNKNIPTGTHCWAIIQDSEFNLISVIDKPQDYKDNELYYFGEVD